MRIAVLILSAIMAVGPATSRQASEAKNSAGLLDSETRTFLARFQNAIRSDDRQAVSKMVRYSTDVNAAGRCKAIGGTAAFIRYFDEVFTPELRALILAQRPEDLIIRSSGVGLSGGAVWFAGICSDGACRNYDIRVTTINGTSRCRK